MLEPLKERTRDTCETRIRGGPPEATGLSQVTQRGYLVSASPVFSSSAVQRITTLETEIMNCMNFGRTLQIPLFPSPQGYSNAPSQVQGHQMPVLYRA